MTWTFPAVTLPAGGYLVVFASGKAQQPYTDPEGYLHTNFKLDSAGGYLALVAASGASVVHAYAPYPQQAPNVSFGLAADGVT